MRQVALGARSGGGSCSAWPDCGAPHLLSAEAPRCLAKPRSPRWRGRSRSAGAVTGLRSPGAVAAAVNGAAPGAGERTSSTEESAARPPCRTPGSESRVRPQRRSAAILRGNPNLLHPGTNSSSSSPAPAPAPAPPAAAALPPPARRRGGCAGPTPAAGKAPRRAGAVRGERRSPPQVGAPGGAGCAPAGGGDGGGGRAEAAAGGGEGAVGAGQRPSSPSPVEVGSGLGDPAWGRAARLHLRKAVGPAAWRARAAAAFGRGARALAAPACDAAGARRRGGASSSSKWARAARFINLLFLPPPPSPADFGGSDRPPAGCGSARCVPGVAVGPPLPVLAAPAAGAGGARGWWGRMGGVFARLRSGRFPRASSFWEAAVC